MDISVLVSTYKRSDVLRKTLESFCQLDADGLDWEILVVDNEGNKLTKETVESFYNRIPIKYLIEPKRGKSKALNYAIPLAKGSLLVFTDDDIIADKKWLKEIKEGVARWPDSYIFGGRVLPYWPYKEKLTYIEHDFGRRSYSIADWKIPEGLYHVLRVIGNNMIIRKEVFKQGWRFDSNLGPSGNNFILSEENEFLKRLDQFGFKAIYLPKAVVYHHVRPEQINVQYFYKRAFSGGRLIAYSENTWDLPMLFGIYRYLVRKFLKLSIRIIISFFRKDRIERIKLGVKHWQLIGTIYEYKRKKSIRNMRKKIGYYSNTNQLGGSEIYLKALLEHIDHENFEVILFCNTNHPLNNDPIIQDLVYRKKKIRVIYIDKKIENKKENLRQQPAKQKRRKIWHKLPAPGLKLFLGTIKEIIRLRKMFINCKVDLLHFNDTGCEPPAIAAKLAGIPVIIGTYHVLPSYDPEKCDWVRRMTENISTRCLDKGIAVSKATKEAWVDRTGVNKENIKVIYNGIDLSKFSDGFNKAILRKELGINSKDLIVGILARLHPMKGHKYLIQAALVIKDEMPNVKFLLIGDGELRDELKKQIKSLKIESYFKFLGHREDIIRLMHLFDIAVLPSVSLETFSYAIVEAMACKKPIIASDFSGIPEVVENGVTGILVPPRDSSNLAKAIIGLLKDKDEMKRMGVAGFSRAEKLFRQDIMLRETYAFYEQFFRKDLNHVN